MPVGRGRDMRPSGPELVAAFTDGVLAQGVDVLDIGLASSDLLYYASGSRRLPAAMFTASHNPAEYNGIKLCHAGALPVDLGVIKSLTGEVLDGGGPRRRIERGGGPSRTCSPTSSTTSSRSSTSAPYVPGGSWPTPPMGWADWWSPLSSSGSACSSSRSCTRSSTARSRTTRRIRCSRPTSAIFGPRVVSGGFDIGLAFDGDADRVFVVDETGAGLSGSTTTAILSAVTLRSHPGATILYNLICSRAVPEVIAENGGVPVRTRVGHSFIKQQMAETGAVFGGEHSAHYYFAANYGADSGLIATVQMLSELTRSDDVLSKVRVPYERYTQSGEINTHVNDVGAVLAGVSAQYVDGRQDHLDGLTVEFDSWWFNLRPSNTEPLLRLNLEAETRDECESRVAELLSLITSN